MLKKILLVLLLGVGLIFVVAALQPADFTVTRAATLNAPAPALFAQVNDFHRWEAWSPWEKMDPAMKKTFSEPATGEGASYAWVGNNQVGEGKITITETRPSELIRMRLEFFKPFAATNMAEFTFQPQGERTAVTWTMSGHNNIFCKAIGLFMNMDKMIGGDFERGLAGLEKAAQETAPSAPNT